MKKIDFTKVRVFTNYKKEAYEVCNVREVVINYLYSHAPASGLTRSLLQRLAENEGEIEITNSEEKLILNLANTEGLITEVFRDSLLIALNQDLLNEKLQGKTHIEEVSATMRELLVEINNQ